MPSFVASGSLSASEHLMLLCWWCMLSFPHRDSILPLPWKVGEIQDNLFWVWHDLRTLFERGTVGEFVSAWVMLCTDLFLFYFCSSLCCLQILAFQPYTLLADMPTMVNKSLPSCVRLTTEQGVTSQDSSFHTTFLHWTRARLCKPPPNIPEVYSRSVCFQQSPRRRTISGIPRLLQLSMRDWRSEMLTWGPTS